MVGDRDGKPAQDVEEGLLADADAVLEVDDAAMQSRVRARLFAREKTETIGPFEVRERLGSGGMGEVFAAFDPRLQRKLALKVLRPDLRRGTAQERLRHRLLREARALAQLEHPNIVRVFDIGVHDEGLYMAMELVDGATLRAWMKDEQPGWEEIVAVFAQAGEALQAAHRAGLVHRDFKPENVLVDRHGRARVLDFGLALVMGDASSESKAVGSVDVESSHVDLGQSLRTHGLVGTPGYMAPEQYLGRSPDAATDQFAFCVSLYEALYGERPFPSGSLAEVGEATVRGEVPAPPRGKCPAWIGHSIMRGLSVQPQQRWPSMQALLRHIRSRTQARARRRGVVLGAAALAGAAALVVALQPGDGAQCPSQDDARRRVWDESRQERVAEQFAAAGGYGVTLWAQLEPRLDGYATQLAKGYAGTCRDTPPEVDLDLAVACLRDAERRFNALVTVLGEADGDTVAHAHEGVADLPDPTACGDAQRLARRSGARLDVSPEAEQLREELAAIGALVHAGQYDDAQERSASVVDAARLRKSSELLSSALLMRGEVLTRVGQPALAQRVLEEAYFTAQRAGVEAVALDAAVALLRHAGRSGGELEGGLRWARHGRALLGPQTRPRDRARLYTEETTLLRELGRFEHAIELGEEAVSTLSRHEQGDALQLAAAHEALAMVLSEAGDYAASESHYRTALAVYRERLGPRHPVTAGTMANTGTVLQRAARHAEAEALYRESLEIRRELLRPEHPSIVGGLINLGSVLYAQGRVDESEAIYLEVIELVGDGDFSSHTNFGWALNNFGTLLGERGRLAEARMYLARARAIFERTYGTSHPAVAGTWNNLGMMALQEKDYPAAQEAFERALAINLEGHGRKHPEVAKVTNNLARVHLGRGELEPVLELTAAALEVQLELLGPRHIDTASSWLTRARALLELGRPREARPLLAKAHAVYAEVMPPEHAGRQQAAELLAAAGGQIAQ